MFRPTLRCLSALRARFFTRPAYCSIRRRAPLTVELLERRDVPATIVWSGAGPDNLASDALNWQGDVLPGAADTIAFDSTGNREAVIDNAFTGTVAGMQLGNGYNYTVHVERTLTITGQLSVSSGLLDGEAQIDLAAGASGEWSDGELYGGGSLVVDAGATLTMAGGPAGLSEGGLAIANDGTTNLGGELTGDGFLLGNRSDGTLNVGAGFTWFALPNTTWLTNEGTLTVGYGGAWTMDGTFTNTGTVTVNSDLLVNTHLYQWDGSISGPGTIEIALGADAEWRGGSLQGPGGLQIDQWATLTIDGAGSLGDSDRAINVLGTVGLQSGVITGDARIDVERYAGMTWNGGGVQGTGVLDVHTGGWLSLNGAGDLTGAGWSLTDDGTVTWYAGNAVGDLTFNVDAAGTLNLAGGQLGNQGWAIYDMGTVRWASGTLAGDATLTVTTTGTLNIAGSGELDDTGWQFISFGATHWTSGDVSTTGVTFDNRAGATFTAQGTLNWLDPAGTSALQNEGVVNVMSNNSSVTVWAAFNTTGAVDVQAGTLQLQGGGQLVGLSDIAGGASMCLYQGTFVAAANAQADGDGVLIVGNGGQATLNVPTGRFDSRAEVSLRAGGAVTGGGTLQVGRLMTWTGGVMSGVAVPAAQDPGTTVILGGAELRVSQSGANASDVTLDNRRLVNYGTVNWQGAANNEAWLLLNGAAIDNLNLFNVALGAGDFEMRGMQGGGTFINEVSGRVVQAGEGFSQFLSVNLNNYGTFRVDGGAVHFEPFAANRAPEIMNQGLFVTAQFSGVIFTRVRLTLNAPLDEDQGDDVLTGDGEYVARNSIVLVPVGVTVAADNFQLDGDTASLKGGGTFEAHDFLWTGGTMAGDDSGQFGTTLVGPGDYLAIAAGNATLAHRELIVKGTAEWLGVSTKISLVDISDIAIDGGTFETGGFGTQSIVGDNPGGIALLNGGIFQGNPSVVYGSFLEIAVPVVNGGGIISLSGDTLVSGTVSNITGVVIAQDNAYFAAAFSNSDVVEASGSTTFAGPFTNREGDVQASGRTTFSGDFENAGDVTANDNTTFSGAFNNNRGGRVWTSGQTVFSGAVANQDLARMSVDGTTTFSGGFTNNSAFFFADGDATFSGGFTQTGTYASAWFGNGRYEFTPASVSQGGTVRLDGGRFVTFGSNTTWHQNTTFELRGTVENDFGCMACTVRLTGNLDTTARLRLAGCDTYLQGNTLHVGGDLTQSNASNPDIGFHQGRMFLGGGTVRTDGQFNEGGSVIGPGTVNGRMAMQPGATMSMGDGTQPGTLTIIGDLVEVPDASLTFCIGAGGNDALVVLGHASLAGTVNVTLLGDYQPNPDTPDQFAVMSFDGYDGTFNNPSIDLGNGLALAVTVEDSGVTLVTQRTS